MLERNIGNEGDVRTTKLPMRKRLCVVLLLVPVLAGCRSEVEEEEPLSAAAFIEQYGQRLCGAYAPCCTSAGFGAPGAECAKEVTQHLSTAGADIYHESLARRCLRELDASPPTCTNHYAPRVCGSVFRGPRGLLEPVIYSGQCAPTEAADEEIRCEHASYKTASYVCLCQRFRLVAGIGERCGVQKADDGAPLEVVVTCKSGLSCQWDGKCHARSEDGGPCPCAEGFSCEGGICTALLPDGAPCGGPLQCAGFGCGSSQVCQGMTEYWRARCR